MSRKPIVSRTIKTTVCSLAVKGRDGMENLKVAIAGSWKDEEDLLKKCRVLCDGVPVIGIIDHYSRPVLYGMSEQKFIEHANVLDIKTRRPIEY